MSPITDQTPTETILRGRSQSASAATVRAGTGPSVAPEPGSQLRAAVEPAGQRSGGVSTTGSPTISRALTPTSGPDFDELAIPAKVLEYMSGAVDPRPSGELHVGAAIGVVPATSETRAAPHSSQSVDGSGEPGKDDAAMLLDLSKSPGKALPRASETESGGQVEPATDAAVAGPSVDAPPPSSWSVQDISDCFRPWMEASTTSKIDLIERQADALTSFGDALEAAPNSRTLASFLLGNIVSQTGDDEAARYARENALGGKATDELYKALTYAQIMMRVGGENLTTPLARVIPPTFRNDPDNWVSRNQPGPNAGSSTLRPLANPLQASVKDILNHYSKWVLNSTTAYQARKHCRILKDYGNRQLPNALGQTLKAIPPSELKNHPSVTAFIEGATADSERKRFFVIALQRLQVMIWTGGRQLPPGVGIAREIPPDFVADPEGWVATVFSDSNAAAEPEQAGDAATR